MLISSPVRSAQPTTSMALVLVMLCLGGLAGKHALAGPPGEFEGRSDVGKIALPGSVEFDAAKLEYRIAGSGANIWGNVDAFYFAWRRAAGDLEMTALVQWPGEGKQAHRKAGWMVRQDLAPDSPYADAVVHGDGLISLQYRRARGRADDGSQIGRQSSGLDPARANRRSLHALRRTQW